MSTYDELSQAFDELNKDITWLRLKNKALIKDSILAKKSWDINIP